MPLSTTNQGLLRGVGGLAGGLASAAVMWVAVEPTIRRAIVLESANSDHEHAHGDAVAATHDHGELVSRRAQLAGGLATALVVGVLLGLAFAIVHRFTRDHLPGRTEVGRSVTLGGLVFAVMGLMPALRTPANPPGVGDPNTVDERTWVYVSTILLGWILVILCFATVDAVRRRLAPEVCWLVTSGVAVLGVAVILSLPADSATTPLSVPADLVWEFRTASLAQLAIQYMTIALVFGVLTARAARLPAMLTSARKPAPLTRWLS